MKKYQVFAVGIFVFSMGSNFAWSACMPQMGGFGGNPFGGGAMAGMPGVGAIMGGGFPCQPGGGMGGFGGNPFGGGAVAGMPGAGAMGGGFPCQPSGGMGGFGGNPFGGGAMAGMPGIGGAMGGGFPCQPGVGMGGFGGSSPFANAYARPMSFPGMMPAARPWGAPNFQGGGAYQHGRFGGASRPPCCPQSGMPR